MISNLENVSEKVMKVINEDKISILASLILIWILSPKDLGRNVQKRIV